MKFKHITEGGGTTFCLPSKKTNCTATMSRSPFSRFLHTDSKPFQCSFGGIYWGWTGITGRQKPSLPLCRLFYTE